MLHLMKTVLFPVIIGCAAVSLIVGTVCKLAPKTKEAFKGRRKGNKKSSNKKKEPKEVPAN